MPLKHSDRDLLILPPALNCGNDKSLLPKYQILVSASCPKNCPFLYNFFLSLLSACEDQN